MSFAQETNPRTLLQEGTNLKLLCEICSVRPSVIFFFRQCRSGQNNTNPKWQKHIDTSYDIIVFVFNIFLYFFDPGAVCVSDVMIAFMLMIIEEKNFLSPTEKLQYFSRQYQARRHFWGIIFIISLPYITCFSIPSCSQVFYSALNLF